MRVHRYSILFIIYISAAMNNKKSNASKTQVYTQNLVASGVAKKFVPLGMSASQQQVQLVMFNNFTYL